MLIASSVRGDVEDERLFDLEIKPNKRIDRNTPRRFTVQCFPTNTLKVWCLFKAAFIGNSLF